MNFLMAIIDAAVAFVRRNPLTCLVILLLALVAPAVLRGLAMLILYFILGLVLLAVVIAALFRWRIYKMRKQMEDHLGGNAGPFGGTPFGQSGGRRGGTPREGEVKIRRTGSAPGKRVSDDVGDYVEFEETKSPREGDAGR